MPPTMDFWCPASATDPESSDIGDLGDFEEPTTPTYESQKNIVDVAYDPRTGVMLYTAGGWGAFSEDPDTSMKIFKSTDCGRTWTQVADMNTITWPHTFYGVGISSDAAVPIQIIPGANPHEWLLFDWFGGYYFTEDDWATHESRQYAGVDGGFAEVGPEFLYYYLGLIGTIFWNQTRQDAVHFYPEAQQHGFTYVIPFLFDEPELFIAEYLGVRRSIGPNGQGGWGDSLAPGPIADGGAGWQAVETYPVMHGANGIWIVCVDWLATQTDLGEVPPMRINTSPDLDPGSWSEPFWPLSEAAFTDIYQGMKTGGSYGVGRVEWYPLPHGKIKFIPSASHPAGGRWWLFGNQDMLWFSDDNGVTWDNSLSDHTGAEEDMHPILNWRASHSIGTLDNAPKILDIVQDPRDSGRLIAIGVTYDGRPGITNRLAVYSCSVDGGDTWGSVGQIPLRLSNISSSLGSNDGLESPAMSRYVFPCVVGGLG